MILLDTNVVSETMRVQPNVSVQTWLNAQVAEAVFLSSITVAEVLVGIGVMPEGLRKRELAVRADRLFGLFETRILPFDATAARCFADLSVKARAAGLGFPPPDGYIAAIAATHGFSVATRDKSAFVAAGVSVINPWG